MWSHAHHAAMHATNCCALQAVLNKHTIAYKHLSADYINISIFSCALPLCVGQVWFQCSLIQMGANVLCYQGFCNCSLQTTCIFENQLPMSYDL